MANNGVNQQYSLGYQPSSIQNITLCQVTNSAPFIYCKFEVIKAIGRQNMII